MESAVHFWDSYDISVLELNPVAQWQCVRLRSGIYGFETWSG